jgi:hypothetical protein
LRRPQAVGQIAFALDISAALISQAAKSASRRLRCRTAFGFIRADAMLLDGEMHSIDITRRAAICMQAVLALAPWALCGAATAQRCESVVRADVVALDQPFQVNRLGTTRTDGEIYALRADVQPIDRSLGLQPGNVMLRPDKRPRPMVLRVNAGSCLEITFTNLLAPRPKDVMQPVTRAASIHVTGLQPVQSISDDGTWVGQNPVGQNPAGGPGQHSGIVDPGQTIVYRLFAQAEGASLLYSTAAQYNNFNEMQVSTGLFGVVNVEPRGSEWYRSQVSQADLQLATRGRLPSGHPDIDYDARYPAGHPRAGLPVLRIADASGRIVHTDLTALVTGPRRGRLPGGAGRNPMLPERDLPFREVSIVYHESQDVVQAFPYFMYATHSQVPRTDAGADSFAINYGIGGIAPQVLANRLGVGPAADCPECKFEEFFLSSWAIGDPAMVVDVPANAPCTTAELQRLTMDLAADPLGFNPTRPCEPATGRKATRAFYPDDPSNVYHSYLGDHVRFRVVHAGAAVHHVHHHHAHQWLRSPDSSESNYLDSQAIGPGGSFTAELVFGGSGNRNLTTGDSIFHCHFYPHFAAGMWALYRVHDVFEAGTALDADGRPRPGARALPDGEIQAGTPIPALVPLPLYAMAPLPAAVSIVNGQVRVDGDGHPGYPFFVPGVAGHRAPHPPMDFAVDPKTGDTLDGGLPRHLVRSATIANEQHTALDWSKDLDTLTAYQLPEAGTPLETRAMGYFGQARHPSYTPEGTSAPFKVNGLPRGPQPGAPFADPAVVDGQPAGNPVRRYKGVNLQLDAVFNKAGWHFPQQRILSLWGDVRDYVEGRKPPEPLFFRASNNDVVEYWHTNLVPAYYELDDFQVRTPTDILGQHIHLVKFDVMASDGAANGFNYEDGSFSPEEVRERIEGINRTGGLWDAAGRQQRRLVPKAIAELGNGPSAASRAWVGAQATVQRWWLDPLKGLSKDPAAPVDDRDRTYMTVFTHDHFGPSTHQMVGLYGGLLIEPADTTWTSLDGKTVFGVRDDGGPTSYAANILFKSPQRQADHYREFALEWGDTQHAYTQGSRTRPDCYRYTGRDGRVVQQAPPDFDCVPLAPGQGYFGWSDPAHVLNCLNCPPQPLAQQPQSLVPNLPGAAPWPPQPLLVSDFGAGMISMNYRGEPLPMRVARPLVANPQAAPDAGDLASAFRSIERHDPAYSRQPVPGAQINPQCSGSGCFRFPLQPIAQGMGPRDPYTPLLQGYEGDKVQIRLLAGAHTSMHDFTMHGMPWLSEPFVADSGYRSTQFIILSEHYELLFNLPRLGAGGATDYLYNPSASYEGLANGAWGLLRAWDPARPQAFLQPLPAAPAQKPQPQPMKPPPGMSTDCTRHAPCIREFEVHAMTVQQALGRPDGSLVYNARGASLLDGRSATGSPLEDPLALVYVQVPQGGRHVPTGTIEPLVLRANAGDWIHVTLVNRFTGREPVFAATEAASRFGLTYAVPYNHIPIASSPRVGLHAQMLAYDARDSDGASIGNNPVQTAPPQGRVEYWWYAGKFEDGQPVPVEFGAVNLLPADPLMQVYRGLFGALVIEPAGSLWVADPQSAASATVWSSGKVFREFVAMYQNDANMLSNGQSWWAVGNPLAGFNYRSEPAWLRFGQRLDGALGANAPADWTRLTATDLQNIAQLPMSTVDELPTTANQLVGADPQTPIFRAPAHMPVRFRLLMPGGVGDNQMTWELTGHLWQEAPYTGGSTRQGHNPLSASGGTITGFGPTSAYNVLLDDTPGSTPAGGRFGVAGDYLYRAWTANIFQAGAWGIFRVAPWAGGAGLPDTVGIASVTAGPGGGTTVRGFVTPCPNDVNDASGRPVCKARGFVKTVRVNGASADVREGRWSLVVPRRTVEVRVASPAGGSASWSAAAAGRPVLGAAAAAPVRAVAPPAGRAKRLPRQ